MNGTTQSPLGPNIVQVEKSSFNHSNEQKRKKKVSSKPKVPKSRGGNNAANATKQQDAKQLQSIISVLQENPDLTFMKEISNARMKVTNNYINHLESQKKKHPILQNKDKFEVLVNALRTVNAQNTALISVDLEAFERNTNVVTEIGISIYDPVKEATSLVPSIINIHILLKETINLRNGAFVHDHKDNFLGGSSLVLSKKDTVSFINTLFQFYFDQRKKDGYEAAFVGHNLKGDLKWLHQLGITVPANPHILDTEKIYSSSHGSNGNSLGSILKRLRIPHSFLHNAGNDAYFTLIALLKLTDPQCRTILKLDIHAEDLKYDEFVKEQELQLKAQRDIPKKLNRPRKALKSHEFSPYIEFFSYEDALLKAFEHY